MGEGLQGGYLTDIVKFKYLYIKTKTGILWSKIHMDSKIKQETWNALLAGDGVVLGYVNRLESAGAVKEPGVSSPLWGTPVEKTKEHFFQVW